MSRLPFPTIDEVKSATKLKDEGVIQAFLETLRWLDQKAPPQFDGLPGKYEFDIFSIVDPHYDEADNHCGTTCCIGGAVMLYESGGSIVMDDDLCLDRYIKMDKQCDFLFFPGGEKTPTEAAEALRNYLFTGKVVWPEEAKVQEDEE